VLAEPATARHIISRPVYPALSIFCATREAGNPHNKYCDYIAWSKWRKRGAWDSTLDNACLRDPSFVPGECSFNAQARYCLGPAHEVTLPSLQKGHQQMEKAQDRSPARD
jgi:hypothetical protein